MFNCCFLQQRNKKINLILPFNSFFKERKCKKKKTPHWLSESRPVMWGRKGNNENTFLCKVLSLHNNSSYVHDFREGMVG